jgi:hypothetical protein
MPLTSAKFVREKIFHLREDTIRTMLYTLARMQELTDQMNLRSYSHRRVSIFFSKYQMGTASYTILTKISKAK